MIFVYGRGKRKSRNQKYLELFRRFRERQTIYTCHTEKRLKEVFKKKQKSKSSYQSEVTVYECEDYGGCPYKEKYAKAKGKKILRKR